MRAVLGMGMMAGCVAELIDECDRVCLMSVCGLGQPLSVSLYVSLHISMYASLSLDVSVFLFLCMYL